MTEPAPGSAPAVAGEPALGPASLPGAAAAGSMIPVPIPAARKRASLPVRLLRRALSVLRPEDWLLAVFLAGSPIAAGRASPGLFDPGQPIQGLWRLAAVLGAVACLAARPPAVQRGTGASGGPAGAGQAIASGSAAIGPLTGGLLLVGVSGSAALGLGQAGAYAFLAVAALVAVAMRVFVPPPSIAVRRVLVAPFVLVAGGLFWSVIAAVFAQPLVSGGIDVAALRAALASPALPFLAAFSGVYYAMLVYAPRQVAEREGGVVEWAVRFGAFLCAVVFGIGWLAGFSA